MLDWPILQSMSPNFPAIHTFFCTSVYFILHCFLCRPSDYTVSEDAGIDFDIGSQTL